MSRRSKVWVPALLGLLFAGPSFAQPRGPAEVMGQAREVREESETRARLGAAPPSEDAVRRALGEPLELASSAATSSLPAGTIRVEVVDENVRPIVGAAIRIGVMKADGGRENLVHETNAEGVLVLSDLPTGAAQSYRVNVLRDGATYSTTPFRLEPDRGQRARVVALPTTRDTSVLLQTLGQAHLEYRDERIHVTMQAQLANLGSETLVFSEDGLKVRLPVGFTAFQSPQQMTDQRLVPDDDGFALKGSIPPGRITLAWAFDIPLSSGDMRVTMPMPFRTFRYRVLSDMSPGMTMEVDGFDESFEHEANGQRFLVAQVQRRPEDPTLETLAIRIRGIPGPGPYRYVAVGAALVLAFFGFLLLGQGGDRRGALSRAREARRQQLLADAAEVERLFEANEVGPKFRQRRMEEITIELATLLRAEGAAKNAKHDHVHS
jgi:hypothetical protein